MKFSRRLFLSASAASILCPAMVFPSRAQNVFRELRIQSRILDIKGKPAKVYRLHEEGSGQEGLHFNKGDSFRVRLFNETNAPELIHWHGLTPPNAQDGVPHLTQEPLAPGQSYDYDFPLKLAGTNWMHTHHSVNEQLLMAAPLIIHDPEDAKLDEQEIVVMLHDFTWKDPHEILAELKSGMAHHHMMEQMQGQSNSNNGAPQDMAAMMRGHLNDVEFDAFLANERTLDDPQIIRTDKGQKVRLRFINAGSSTNFWINLDQLQGQVIAVDGRPVKPVTGRRFPLAMAQRMDIRIALPSEEGAWPIFAEREGDFVRTGIILHTGQAPIKKIADRHEGEKTPAVDLSLETLLEPLEPLPAREVDRKITMDLMGSMMNFAWNLSDPESPHEYLSCQPGERVEVKMVNHTDMLHPMHLHGHHFQVVEMNGKRLQGAVRDTVIVPLDGTVTIAFDANNPGRWMYHCHNLYHMLSGMMTELRYGV